MTPAVSQILPVLFLLGLGALLGRRKFLSSEVVEGLKRIVASISLPALLFLAFSRVHVQGRLALLALIVFTSCGLMGGLGYIVSRSFGLPRPSTVFLFQGFEAGMLGYSLFLSLYGEGTLHTFAAADLGQVLFVFTVLMFQLRWSETKGSAPVTSLIGNMFRSPVMLAILAGLVSATLDPGARIVPWRDGGSLYPFFRTIGSITTPLVCLVVGFGLKDIRLRGTGTAVTATFLRILVGAFFGAFIGGFLVPVLGYERIQSVAILVLFLLPPPFIIPIFFKQEEDQKYLSSVLSIHTLVSIVLIAGVGLVWRA
ncbi:MAG: auxin efflux carrier [Spirochaetales bacterium]